MEMGQRLASKKGENIATQLVLQLVDNTLRCTTTTFPWTYLGLPISNKKLRQITRLEAALVTMADRATLVCFVLTAIPWILVDINPSKWFISEIDKIRKGFLWKGRQVNGSRCSVAWEKVARPSDLGGLGIHNLEIMVWALQTRCLWFEKTRPDRPWAGLPVHARNLALLANLVVTSIGNQENTLFLLD
jgi:hypothetical protein